jgi:hypothetical protein
MTRACARLILIPRNGACFRCGRTSHFSKNCHAKTHLSGSPLPPKKKPESTDDEEKLTDEISLHTESVLTGAAVASVAFAACSFAYNWLTNRK